MNPFERIRSTEGKVSLLLAGLAALCVGFELLAPAERTLTWHITRVVAVLIYIGLGTYGTARIVARPVRRAKAHVEAIAHGVYTRPVRTRRTDEFGDMLRGLEQMRCALVAALDARDAADRKYREIVERSVQGFYQSTEEGQLLAANDALARLLGYESREQLLAQPVGFTRSLHADAARRHEFTQRMRTHGHVNGFEEALKRRDGSIVWVTESARIVADPVRGGEFWEGFLDDITERKQAEQLKSDFVSFVTHQLRTPLSGIRWMLELAADAASPEETQSFVADAHASAERLIRLVNDLLDIARLEAGRLTTEPELLHLHETASALTVELKPLAVARHQTLTLTGSAPHVFVDAQLMRQAVLNLVSNALKYTPEGGSVHLFIEHDDDTARLHVRDSGIGISEQAQARLFEKFFRADNAQTVDTEGTGLGLYLVRLIAERSGGTVTCSSREGAGSTFTLSIPLAKSNQVAA
jgi:PAS domain S-box-containing protein